MSERRVCVCCGIDVGELGPILADPGTPPAWEIEASWWCSDWAACRARRYQNRVAAVQAGARLAVAAGVESPGMQAAVGTLLVGVLEAFLAPEDPRGAKA